MILGENRQRSSPEKKNHFNIAELTLVDQPAALLHEHPARYIYPGSPVPCPEKYHNGWHEG